MTTARLASKLGLNSLKVWEGSLQEKLGKTFYQLATNTIESKPFYLNALENKVVLVCNIAGKSSWANGQFDKLAKFPNKYRGQLQILMYPCKDFGKNELGSMTEVRDFHDQYASRFHIMERTDVNGPEATEVFRALKHATGTDNVDIDWDYQTKFLVSREGVHVERFSGAANPHDLVPFIDRLVGELDPHEEEVRLYDDATVKSPASFVNTG